jgi:hypothetical protein
MTEATARATRAKKPAAAKAIPAEAAPAPRTEARAEAPKTEAPKAKAAKPRFEQARKAFADTRDFAKGNVDALTASFGAASQGFGAVRDQSLAFAQARLQTNLAAAQSLTTAKSVSDVIDVQHAFAKGAIEAYGAQFAKLSETLTTTFNSAAKPIGDRARAVYASVVPGR